MFHLLKAQISKNYVLLSARGQICSDLCSKFCKKIYNQLYIALTKIAFISSVHFTDFPALICSILSPSMHNLILLKAKISISENENKQQNSKEKHLKKIIRVCILILALWDFFCFIQMFFRVPTYCKSKLLTHFIPLASFYIPWKQRFSDVLRRY